MDPVPVHAGDPEGLHGVDVALRRRRRRQDLRDGEKLRRDVLLRLRRRDLARTVRSAPRRRRRFLLRHRNAAEPFDRGRNHRRRGERERSEIVGSERGIRVWIRGVLVRGIGSDAGGDVSEAGGGGRLRCGGVGYGDYGGGFCVRGEPVGAGRDGCLRGWGRRGVRVVELEERGGGRRSSDAENGAVRRRCGAEGFAEGGFGELQVRCERDVNNRY